MQAVKISSLKDGAAFKISDRPEGVVYRLQTKRARKAWYTSTASGNTYKCSLNTTVYVREQSKRKRVRRTASMGCK